MTHYSNQHADENRCATCKLYRKWRRWTLAERPRSPISPVVSAPTLDTTWSICALFGSVARGDSQPDSDIDILVIVQPDWERARLERLAVDIAFDVNLQQDLYISPRVLTAGMLAHPVWGQTPFLKNIQRESVAL